MSFISRIGIGVLSGMLIVGSASAASTAIEGTVRDANGQPINGADVRIETKDQKTSKVTKSDAKGHYTYGGLDSSATYRVSLLVGGTVKASINNVRTKMGEATQLNFNLKKEGASAAKSAKKSKHMVWMPAETGTNLGGRWVEVDDNGNADNVSNDNLQKAGSNSVKNIQSNSGAVRGNGQ
jgi:hypothetical protein